MSVDCERIQEALLHHIEGEISDVSSVLAMESHLEACPVCRERAESIKILNRLMAELPRKKFSTEAQWESSVAPFLLTLPRKAPAPGLDLKILEAIRNERGEARTESKSGSVLKLVRSVAAAAAIIAVLSVLGYQTIGSRDDYHKHQNIQITLGKSLYFHSLSGNDLIGERGK